METILPQGRSNPYVNKMCVTANDECTHRFVKSIDLNGREKYLNTLLLIENGASYIVECESMGDLTMDLHYS